MSRENIEIWHTSVEGVRAALSRGEVLEATISEMAKAWDPAIELDATESPVLDVNRVHRGADAARLFWQEWFAAWETIEFDYELLEAPDRVVMLLDLKMRGRSTGIEMPFGKVAWVGTFNAGRVVHMKLYMSQAQGLEAAGLTSSQQDLSQCG